MKAEVIKRDGKLEEYSETKITKVVLAAGLNQPQANSLVTNITEWIKTNSLFKLSSLKIRDKVTEELKKISQEAYNLYTWYEKTKDSL